MNTANSTWNRGGTMNAYFGLGEASVDAAIDRLGWEAWVHVSRDGMDLRCLVDAGSRPSRLR